LNKILIVDDEKNMLYALEKILVDSAYEIITAESGRDAIKKVKKESPNLVLMDIQMPELDGLSAFKEIKKDFPRQTVIMMTGHGTTETAIEDMRLRAFDYITKTFDIKKKKNVVTAALNASQLMSETVELKQQIKDVDLNSKSIIGMSPGMQEIYKMIGQIATSDVSILINGESGTGKELVARAIYNYSNRSREKFMALNCAAIPEHLLESELFGYEKGAFTGAADKRIGKFEQVSGGTLFLDEIGDMPMPLQAKLLRVLQEKQIERVGGTETIPVDVRIISATNRDLEKEIKTGKFREDLFYRLNVVTVKIPPLRDRKEDIPDLVDYFVARGNLEYKKSVKEISKKALETLMNYSWPGNVRQLENVIKKAVVICSGSVLTMDDEFIKKVNDNSADAVVSGAMAPAQAVLNDFPGYFEKNISNLFDQMMLLPEEHSYREDMLAKIEKILIEKSLNYFEGNQVKTAKFLGMTRNTLRSRIEEK